MNKEILGRFAAYSHGGEGDEMLSVPVAVELCEIDDTEPGVIEIAVTTKLSKNPRICIRFSLPELVALAMRKDT